LKWVLLPEQLDDYVAESNPVGYYCPNNTRGLHESFTVYG